MSNRDRRPARSLDEFFGNDPARKRRAILGAIGIALVLLAFFAITIAVVLAVGRGLTGPGREPELRVPESRSAALAAPSLGPERAEAPRP